MLTTNKSEGGRREGEAIEGGAVDSVQGGRAFKNEGEGGVGGAGDLMEGERGWRADERGGGLQVYPAPTTTTTTDPLLFQGFPSDGRSRHQHTHTHTHSEQTHTHTHTLTKPGVQPPVAHSLLWRSSRRFIQT